jgi:thiamine-phosphate pyrophosphorylase
MIELGDRSLYLCTPGRDDLEAFLAACIAGGVDIVQLRDKVASPQSLRKASARCREVCRDLGVPFIVNDSPELAYELEADGVHVGQDDAPVARCRELLGDEAIVGLSTHAEVELLAATTQDLTYLSAGPVEATPTKPGRAGTGTGYLSFAREHSRVPVFVTGGVTPERVEDLGALGLRRFVVVRALTESADPFSAAQALRRAIDSLDG